MHRRPDITPLIGRELPSPPLPWNYDERLGAAHEIFIQAAREHADEDFARAAVSYSIWAASTFLMPGSIANLWGSTLLQLNDVNNRFFTTTSEEEYLEMVDQFETEHLGLPELPTGTRWWASAAGGSGGSYPSEAVAAVMNMTSQELLDYVRDNKKGRGYVLARSDVYVFAITDTRSPETLSLDGINRLNKFGERLLDTVLIAYSSGKKDTETSKLTSIEPQK